MNLIILFYSSLIVLFFNNYIYVFFFFFNQGNVSAVMEQLNVLETLQGDFQKDVESFGLDRTEKIVEAIKGTDKIYDNCLFLT